MSERRILVLGEGPNELGRRLGTPLSADCLPPLPRLVHRLLGEPKNAVYVCDVLRYVRPARGRGHRLARKVAQAMLAAQASGYHGLVVVVDRDRNADSDRLEPMRQGRDQAASVLELRCSVGTAVEAFDAWMIVDGNAVRAAGGDHRRCHGSPETLAGHTGSGHHPKDRAVELFGGLDALTDAYTTVAVCADLDLLRRQCPRGFATFAEDVESWISPVVSPSVR